MISCIISAALALTMSTADIQPVPKQVDTTDIYIIDNVPVDNFDGSQIVGKTIAFYQINRSKDKAVRVHSIVTESKSTPNAKSSATTKVVVHEGQIGSDDVEVSYGPTTSVKVISAAKVVYVVNGKVVSDEVFRKMEPSQIKAVQVIKNKEIMKQYTDDTTAEGVIKITTK